MNFPKLDAVLARLAAKQKELGDIFEQAGPNLDFDQVKSLDGDNEDKVAHVQKLNDECTAISKERDELASLKAIAEQHAGKSDTGTESGGDDGDDGAEPGGDEIRKGRKRETLGDKFFKSGSHQNKGQEFELADVDVKATFITSAGWAPDVVREPGYLVSARLPIVLLDFIPAITTTRSSIAYMEETTYTNAAVEVAEGAAKPEAALALTEQTAIVRKIAVYLPVTDEQLEDVPEAREYLDSTLPFMVRQRLASQIVVGTGAGVNIRGILNVAGIQTQAKGADPTPDAVYKAMTKIRVTGQAEPDAVVFHPNDWQDVRLLRTADGIYIWGSPSEAGPERIWGLQVVQEQGLTENTAVVGAWRMFARLYVRKGVTVQTGYNASDWTTNKQTIRAEMRAVPVYRRPAAFCTVTGI